MHNNISPVKKRYDNFALIIMGVTLLGAFPMVRFENLEGFALVYFIIYLSTIFLSILAMIIAFPFIRRAEIEFFKNKFTSENMEKFANIDLDKEDFIFYCNNTDIEFKNNKIIDLLTGNEYLYDKCKIYAFHQCCFAGEIYKIFVVFEADEQIFSLKLDDRLYSIIRYYNISVENLADEMSQCENNLKAFFKDKKLRREALERQKIDHLN